MEPVSKQENEVSFVADLTRIYVEEDNNNEPLSLIHSVCGLFSVDVSSKVPIEIAQQSNQITSPVAIHFSVVMR